LPFAHYTPASDRTPLPSAEVIKTYQDRDGYLWFVIFSSGIVRYDGHSFETYTTSDGLRDLAVWEVVEDRSGRLWVGSNAGLAVSDRPLGDYRPGERIRFVTRVGGVDLVDGLINRNRLVADAGGRVWAGTAAAGIVRYHIASVGDSVRASCDTLGTDPLREGRNATVRSLVSRRDGSVCAGIGGGKLLIFPSGSDTPAMISQAEGLPTQSITTLYEAPDGVLWGGCRNGSLWRLDETAGAFHVVPVSERITASIAAMLATSDSVLWVASDGAGVMKLNPAHPESAVLVTRADGLLSDNVHHLSRDLEGSVWFSQSGGVSKLRANHEAFRSYTAATNSEESSKLPSPAVNVVIPPSAADPTAMWLGTTESGVVAIRTDGTVATLDTDDGLRNNWVNGLVFDDAGRLWMGTATGINCLTFEGLAVAPPSALHTRVRVFEHAGVVTGYRNTSVYTCFRAHLPGRDGLVESLWFAGIQNLFCRVDERWWVMRERAGLPVTSFHSVAVDRDGFIWVGTRDHGLYRSHTPLTLAALEASSFEAVTLPPEEGGGDFGREITAPIFEAVWSRETGAPTNQIEAILWRDGALWVGTPVGLFVFEGAPPRVVAHFTSDEGLRAPNATAMAFSPSGTLWVGTNGGLTEIDTAKRRVNSSVTRQDGLVGNEVWFYGSVAVGDDSVAVLLWRRAEATTDDPEPAPVPSLWVGTPTP